MILRMEWSPLTALSPLDGRYQNQVAALRPYLSEYALIRHRVLIEIRWLMFLIKEKIPSIPSNPKVLYHLERILDEFNVQDAEAVKIIEQRTNHDTKAVEYFLQEQFHKQPLLKPYIPFIHFGCTSEDINNLAYSIMLRDALDEVINPALQIVTHTLQSMVAQYADLPLLARTHGQPATPTTLGKELANFTVRLHHVVNEIHRDSFTGKMNGAVGNFNAHTIAYPEIDWPTLSKRFVESLGLVNNAYTTQIEPHDRLAAFLQNLIRLNNILINLCRDLWGYISIGYFFQKSVSEEVGSSTMPHKINPIDFENAEGNLGICNALSDHLANKLPISRWQRDLTDSTVMRNLGVTLGYGLLAYQSLLKGLDKIEVNTEVIHRDLESHWEVLAEAIQTTLRRYGNERSYEILKDLTRGKSFNSEQFKKFIEKLSLPSEVKQRLEALTPHTYLGFSVILAKRISELKST